MSLDSVVQQVHGLLLNHLPLRAKRSPKGWISFNCPLCGDRRRRGGVITNGYGISFHCFNCTFKTSWNCDTHISGRYRQLATAMGAPSEDIDRVVLLLLKNHYSLAGNSRTEDEKNLFPIYPTIKLPEGAVPVQALPPEHPLRVYAQDRGILNLTDLWHFSTVPYTSFDCEQRVHIPFYYQGRLVGWTGRLVGPRSKYTPKYQSHVPSDFVFNTDSFYMSERKTVVVVEGVVDALMLDAVAVLGNSISDKQLAVIQQLGDNVILCPDHNRAGEQLVDQAISLGWQVSYPPWAHDCSDAAEACQRYGRLATLASVFTHATDNYTKVNVLKNLRRASV